MDINLTYRRARFLLGFCIFYALFYGASIYFISDTKSLWDPLVPLWFKILKDGFFLLSFALIIFFVFYKRLTISMSILYQGMMVFLALICFLDLLVSYFKYGLKVNHIGILKNFALYYPMCFFVVGMLGHPHLRNLHLDFYGIFRRVMFYVLLFGLLLYLVPFLELKQFTLEGRLISSLANPNILAYLCVLNIMIIYAEWHSRRFLGLKMGFELFISLLGLFFSGSIAGFLLYTMCSGIFGVMLMAGWINPCRNLLLFLLAKVSLILSVLVALVQMVVYNIIPENMIRIFHMAEKIRTLLHLDGSDGDSISYQWRVQMLVDHFNLGLRDTLSFVFGTDVYGTYLKTDSYALNILLNNGFISFLLWGVFFGYPLFLYVSRFWELRKYPNSRQLSHVHVLAVFMFSSFVFHFWMQYAPETYPSCFFIAWSLAYLNFYLQGDILKRVAS